MTSPAPRAGKPFVINQKRVDGTVVNPIPKYTLCHACWRPIPDGEAYCSPEHAAAHQRLSP